LKYFFCHLNEGEERTLYKQIAKRNLVVVGKKLKQGLLVVCSNIPNPDKILKTYRTRWSIERCFKNMKTQGFNLENTHMTCLERLKKLMTVVALSVLLACLVGLHQHCPFKKTLQSPLYSFFTRGLRWIKNNLYHQHSNLGTQNFNQLWVKLQTATRSR
jgi:hypothetical protein